MAEIIGYIGRAQTLSAELSTPQTITGSLCGGASHGIPAGGEPGQGLIKVSDADYDVKWMSILPEDTASGAVASFPDGADDLPMGVVVDIDPVQDLHGYDNPWPGGGGLNKVNPSDLTPGWIYGSTGTINLQDSTKLEYTSDFIKIPSGATSVTFGYDKYETNISDRWVAVGLYDENKVFVIRLIGTWVSSTSGLATEDISSYTTAKYARFCSRTFGHGTEYLYGAFGQYSAFSPYSNICPISGRSEVSVTRTGKNLLDESTVVSRRDNQYFPADLKKNTDYTFSTDSSIHGLYVQYSDADTMPKVGVGWTTLFSRYSTTYVSGNSGSHKWYQLMTFEANDVTAGRKFQLELGSTAHAYEPYQGVTHEIPFSTDVFGGKLNVETGELVVTNTFDDLGTLDWKKSSSFEGAFYASLSKQYPGNSSNIMLCDGYGFDGARNKPPYYPDNGKFTYYPSPSIREVYFKNTSFSSSDDFKSSVNGMKIVYPLATPVTLTLTHVEIRSLFGDNNVWADTGDVSVTYKADVQKYIDKKISAAVAAMS